MMNVTVSPEIASVCPDFVGACLDAQVQNSHYSEALWEEIHQLENHFRDTLTTESLKEISSIAATRRVYKACGKDPHAIVRLRKPLSEGCCKAKSCTR